MRSAPALAVALATALVAVGPAAAADTSDREYTFPDTCDADAILAASEDCVDGVVEIDMHDDGSVTWMRETVYPRDAFEAYVAEYEGWDGTLEEYLVDQLSDLSDDSTDVETSVTADVLTVRFTSELTPEDDAMLMGFALAEDGDLYAAVDITSVSGASLVTLTAPGTIEEANGTVDGLTVTWDADALATLDELDVHALTSTSSSVLPSWLIPSGIALLVLLGIAGFLGFARRPERNAED